MLNMFYEIKDAIEENYKDNPELQIDCMMWLFKNVKGMNEAMIVGDWFVQRNLCPTCGEKMEVKFHREYFPYGDTVVNQNFTEMYCPRCDV